MSDNKINPRHYAGHPIGFQAISLIEDLPFNVGTAIKYLWRAGLKDGESISDELAKAIWYLEREDTREYKDEYAGVPSRAYSVFHRAFLDYAETCAQNELECGLDIEIATVVVSWHDGVPYELLIQNLRRMLKSL